MQVPPDVQAQLRSLAISKEQRPAPAAARRTAGGRILRVVALLAVLALPVAGYVSRGKLAPVVSDLRRGGDAAPVRLMTVTVGEEPGPTPVLTATGKIVSDHRVAVATKVSGQIVSMHFEQGDRVEEGRVLARIEDVRYRALRDEAAARLEQSRANLAFQAVNFERVSRLLRSQSAPEIEYAEAERALEDAKARMGADEATLVYAQQMLDDCKVTAPISGVILVRNVEVGDFVAAEGGRGANANAQFAIIADTTKLRVEVDISELDIDRIRKDMPCVVIPDAYKDRRYRGHVLWIDPGANYSKATVQVKVRIEGPDDHLRVEGSAQVAFLSESPADVPTTDHASAIWIPSSALVMNPADETAAVFTAVDGRLRKTRVTIGRRSGDRVEITAGLSAGQSIAADGVDRLADGQRIPR